MLRAPTKNQVAHSRYWNTYYVFWSWEVFSFRSGSLVWRVLLSIVFLGLESFVKYPFLPSHANFLFYGCCVRFHSSGFRNKTYLWLRCSPNLSQTIISITTKYSSTLLIFVFLVLTQEVSFRCSFGGFTRDNGRSFGMFFGSSTAVSCDRSVARWQVFQSIP